MTAAALLSGYRHSSFKAGKQDRSLRVSLLTKLEMCSSINYSIPTGSWSGDGTALQSRRSNDRKNQHKYSKTRRAGEWRSKNINMEPCPTDCFGKGVRDPCTQLNNEHFIWPAAGRG